MNIAFPLPLCNLTSILHLQHWDEQSDRLRLTTFPADRHAGDQGVYLRGFGLTVRLPLNETIDVWKDGADLRARHRLWCFGLRYLTLNIECMPAQ